MKALMTLAFALFISAFSLQAQNAAAVEKEARAKTDKLAESLELTEDQDVLIYRQNYELVQNAARLKKIDAPKDEKESIGKAYIKRYEQSLKEILTEEQYDKYIKIRNNKKDKAYERMSE
jgi:hypothetical protein